MLPMKKIAVCSLSLAAITVPMVAQTPARAAQPAPASTPMSSPAPAPTGGVPKAQTAPGVSPSPSANPSASPSATPTPLYQFSGYVDVSHTSLHGANALQFTSGVADRVFDTQKSGLQPNALDLAITHNSSGMLGGKIEVLGGNDANIIQSYSFSNTNNFSIMQAYLSYTTGLFTATAGKYVTFAGAEVIQSPQNTNFSRSILFGYAVPFTHTGVRLTYAPNSIISVTGGVNNGWDSFNDPNGAKTLEGAIAYTPNKIVTLNLQGYTGKEPLSLYPLNPITGNRTLIDAVATFHASTPLSFVVNYDLGTQANAPLLNGGGGLLGNGTAVWDGVAGYINYQFPTLPIALSARAETFYDANGYRTGLQQRWNEQTFTIGITPFAPFTIRGEYRNDTSSVPAFLQADGSGRRQQHTLGVEALLKISRP